MYVQVCVTKCLFLCLKIILSYYLNKRYHYRIGWLNNCNMRRIRSGLKLENIYKVESSSILFMEVCMRALLYGIQTKANGFIFFQCNMILNNEVCK